MNEILMQAILARKAFNKKARMIYGTTNQPNIYVSCKFNVSWSYDTVDGKWHASGGSSYGAMSDSTGRFEIIIPDSLVLHNLTFDTEYGGGQNNVDYITSINLSYIGNTDEVDMLLFAFSNLKEVVSISGFNQFKHSPIKSMEGCFRTCESITELDFTGLNTNYMVKDTSVAGGSRYGFPICFYGCTSLHTLTLPKIPYDCYMGSGTFVGCSSLTSVSCSNSIHNSIIMEESPLTLASTRTILSSLSSNHANSAKCLFKETSWYEACNDSQCSTYIANALNAGWDLPATVYYADDCKTVSKFIPSSRAFYSTGVESSSDTHPNQIALGHVYAVVNETSSANPHDYCSYKFAASPGIDLSQASTLTIEAKAFDYTGSEQAGTGLVRNGITTTNNNFKLYVMLEDAAGNLTAADVADDSNTTLNAEKYNGTQSNFVKLTYTLNFPSSFVTRNVVGIRFAYIKSSDSFSNRKKGCWFGSVSVK